MSGLMKFETPFSDHDYAAEDFSQHDISNEVTIGNGFEDWEDQNSGRRTPRRNLKKPQTFVPEQPKKAVATKRKKSTEKNGPKRGGSKKAKKEEPIKYEVDYIFGKRPDKERKGKWEYRVLWKNFPRTEATWEPEENLRFCDEAVKAYEQGQLEEGIVGNNDEDEVEVDVVGNGKAATKNANVTMRKKEESKKLVRSRSTKPPKAPEKKEKVLGTMRARTISVSPVKKQVARRTGHKSKNQANKEKEVSPALSHSTSGGSSDPPPLVVDVKKANSSVKKKENNKGGKAQQPTSTSHLANINSRAKSESVSSKEGSSGGTGGSSNVQDIAMVESVKRSNIEGVGLVAKVIFKDGLSKKMTVKSVKEKVPLVLIEYYEKELGLID